MTAATTTENNGHVSVLVPEVLEALEPKAGHFIVDLTFGRGGHTKKILENGANVIAFDADSDAVSYAHTHFTKEIEQKRFYIFHENFDHLEERIRTLPQSMQNSITGVFADFGVSSNQLDEAGRGFSMYHDGALDMRMDARLGVTAKDLVNALGKNELIMLLTKYAQEERAKQIAQVIVESRKLRPFETTKQLVDAIAARVPRRGNLHPATKTFLALRIAVNDEVGVIETMLPQAIRILAPNGRLVTISFQETEDRIVKHFMKDLEQQGMGRNLYKKPVEASEQEIAQNPRSRSAKLRAFEKGTV